MLELERAELETILAQQLGPVAAPGELWARVHFPRERAVTARRPMRLAWAAAAVVLLVGSAVGIHMGTASETERFRGWVKASTGLDIRAACTLCHESDYPQAGVY